MSLVFHSSFKIPLELKRYPIRKNERLQAWDSSDELLVDHLSSIQDLQFKRILIINDQFGALSSVLVNLNITVYTDSFLSFKGIEFNTSGRISALSRLEDFDGLYDLVLIRIPKNMSFFEDILCHLTHYLKEGSQVICAGMLKHMASLSFSLLNQIIGETHTSLARKKARLIFSNFQRKKVESPYPLRVPINVDGKDLANFFGVPLINYSNLFSREKLDIGTRFLLENIPYGNYKSILDLGCANGIVGIVAKKLNPGATITFCDESKMAIQSAMLNYSRFFQDQAKYLWTNCYEGQDTNSVDLVICNPPFHQGNVLVDDIAIQMFKDARQSLVKGGQIRVIGNYHLKYQIVLKKIFGNMSVIAKNEKFVIIDSVK